MCRPEDQDLGLDAPTGSPVLDGPHPEYHPSIESRARMLDFGYDDATQQTQNLPNWTVIVEDQPKDHEEIEAKNSQGTSIVGLFP